MFIDTFRFILLAILVCCAIATKILKEGKSVQLPIRSKASVRMYNVRQPLAWSSSEQQDKFDFALDTSEFQFVPNEPSDFSFAFDTQDGHLNEKSFEANHPPTPDYESDDDKPVSQLSAANASNRKSSSGKSSQRQSDDYDGSSVDQASEGANERISNRNKPRSSKDEDFNDDFFADKSNESQNPSSLSHSSLSSSPASSSSSSSRPKSNYNKRHRKHGDESKHSSSSYEARSKQPYDYDMALEVDGNDDSVRPTLTLHGNNRPNHKHSDDDDLDDDDDKESKRTRPGQNKRGSSSSPPQRTNSNHRRPKNSPNSQYND